MNDYFLLDVDLGLRREGLHQKLYPLMIEAGFRQEIPWNGGVEDLGTGMYAISRGRGRQGAIDLAVATCKKLGEAFEIWMRDDDVPSPGNPGFSMVYRSPGPK